MAALGDSGDCPSEMETWSWLVGVLLVAAVFSHGRAQWYREDYPGKPPSPPS